MSNPHIRRTGARAVYEDFDRFGVYLWEVDGRFVADENGNFLSISSEYGDIKRISEITRSAAFYGVEGGKPRFFPGHRKVTDEEYKNQQDRLSSGLIPDDHDISSLVDDMRNSNG